MAARANFVFHHDGVRLEAELDDKRFIATEFIVFDGVLKKDLERDRRYVGVCETGAARRRSQVDRFFEA